MSRLPLPRSLFAQTGLALAFAFALFLALTLFITFRLILQPVSEHAMEDLAALIVLSVQTWAELPPDTRADYEKELEQRHHLHLSISVLDKETPTTLLETPRPYTDAIREALRQRLGQTIPAGTLADREEWYWFDIPMAGRLFRVGVADQRLANQTPLAALIILIAGTLFILLTTALLVRRLIKPLAQLADSTKSIGRGEFPKPLLQNGPEEIATLAQSFNHMVAQLKQLNANRTTLLAGISHDIRTPLTHIRLAVEMLPDDIDPQLLEHIRRDLDAMNSLIDQVMQLSRGLHKQDRRMIDITDLLRQLQRENVGVSAEIRVTAEAPCLVTLSETALRRILDNLLENAIRYGAGKPIELACRCEADKVYISVSDQGPGIAVEHRDQVFQPFYRIEDSRNRQTGGSGLGLAIVKQLAETNGWTTKLHQNDYGGALFSIEIDRNTITR